jgi:hypothetical protein
MSTFSLNPDYQESQVLLQHLLPQYEQQARLIPTLIDEIHLSRARMQWLQHEGLLCTLDPQKTRRPTREDFPNFNEQAYLEMNPDVRDHILRKQFASAWDHFSLFGYREGRLRSPHHFNEASYLSLQFDVREAVQKGQVASGFAHYTSIGLYEKRLFIPTDFDEQQYLDFYPDVRDSLAKVAGSTAIQHFCAVGQMSGRLYFVKDKS